MLVALTRQISPSFDDCELTYLSREKIDIAKAIEQQKAYEKCLSELGLRVVSLPPEPDLPDAVFVEDTAVVVDEVAVITRMGAVSRRPEVESIAAVLEKYRPLKFIDGGGTLEGGDVVRAGRTLFVGVSTRTNLEGINQLRNFLEPYDYEVIPVEVHGCLHLKTGCTYLGQNTVIINRLWVDAEPFKGFEMIIAPPHEQWASNVLVIGDDALAPACCPQTAVMVRSVGLKVHAIDASELEKAEGSMTCMSVVFKDTQ